MDPIDVVVESLLKAASTEVVKRGIEAISSRLSDVFKSGNAKEIKTVIAEQNLTEHVARLAKDNLDRSYILPFTGLKEAKPEHKVDFFQEIIKFGFEFSIKNSMDIMVPGSFLGPENMTIFSTIAGPQKITREKLAVSFELGSKIGSLYIIPTNDIDDSIKIFNNYKKYAQRLRQETDSYVSSPNIYDIPNVRFIVNKITAGSVYFNYAVLFSDAADKCFGEKSSRESFYITDWSAGIRSILKYASELPETFVLPAEEGMKLIELSDELRKFYSIQ